MFSRKKNNEPAFNPYEAAQKEELTNIDERFGDLMKSVTILTENARDKYKQHVRKHFDIIMHRETEYYEQVNDHDFIDYEGNKEEDNYDVSKLNMDPKVVEQKLATIPKFNMLRFEKIRMEVLEYTKQKLKKLLELHVLSVNFSMVLI